MPKSSTEPTQPSHALSVFTVGALLTLSTSVWLAKINSIVPDPYLDEGFHVRQAQLYCSGDFKTWDPKITTPPGLYLISELIHQATGRCSITDLRALNVFTVLVGYMLTCDIVQAQRKAAAQTQNSLLSALTAGNIWLFPPLFFFSGLYYTDVQSAFWTLVTYRLYLRYERRGFSSWSDGLWQVVFGVVALFFRQTNIFWVAVFPAGLALASEATRLSTRTKGAFGGVRTRDPSKIISDSWTKLRFYDLPVYEARIEDYLLTALSLVVVTIANYRRTIAILLPYLTLLTLFTTFIYYNGSVVLGDKQNHTATLHLPQMLYLWPYILFFSWPLLLSSLLQGHIPLQLSKSWSRLIFILGTLTNIAMVVIHFNTIIHPFTLADNRHYVFYVFRLLMGREEIRYLAAPIYVLCGYGILQMLGAKPAAAVAVVVGKKAKQVPAPSTGNPSSFVLVWLITTALSLVTAPLVEPRYCIIPWIMWRLRVPVPAAEQRQLVQSETKEKNLKQGRSWALYGTVVETLWFIAIAFGTGYMFLYRGFSWPQEPGKIQRFMW